MSQNPLHLRPPVCSTFDTEQIYKPVQVWLEIIHSHTYETIDIPLQPGTHVVNQSHVLQIVLIFGVGFVCFTDKFQFLNKHVMSFLAIVNYCWAFNDMVLKCFIDPCGWRLAVSAYNGIGILVDINSHNNTDQILGQSAFLFEIVIVKQRTVEYIKAVFADECCRKA